MSKKNPYSKREREINNIAKSYERSREQGKDIYMDADDLADLADWYFSNHEEEAAWDVIEAGLAMHPDNTTLWVEKANLLIEVDRIEEAEQIAESLDDDSDGEAIILRAKLLMLHGKEQEAQELLNLHDFDVDAIGVAYMYLETNRPQEALEWLERIQPEEGEDAEEEEMYLSCKGDCLQALKRYDEAVEVINQLIDRDPYAAQYWYGLAMCYYQQGLYEKAMNAADFAVVSDEEFGNAYALRGDIFQCLGNREKAREDYVKAIELKALSPDFLQVFDIEDLLNEGKWQEAIAILYKETKDKTKLPSYRAEAMSQLAYCLINLGQSAEAEEWLQRSLRLDDLNATTYLLLGRIKMEINEESEAVFYWKKALQLEPFDYTWERIANQCLVLQRFDYMEACYEEIKKIRPNDRSIDMMLAIISLIQGNEEKFLSYNRTSEHPFSEQQVREYKRLISHTRKEELSEALLAIVNKLNI